MRYTIADGTETDCDCSEEFGPCESHAVTLVIRAGASNRTADELALVLISDCLDLGAILSAGDRAEYDRLSAVMSAQADPIMSAWYDDPDDSESVRELADTAESALGDAVPYTYVYQDDGYVISRITSGPLLDDPTDYESDVFTRGHLAANLWANVTGESETGEAESHDARGYDVDDTTLDSLANDARDFLWSNLADVRTYADSVQTTDGDSPLAWAGHDFALSRAGHGAGFFDRGLGELGERLQKAAGTYGDPNLWLDVDGTVRQ